MRRLFALLAVPAALISLGTGCRVVTGVCDCGEYPGEGVPYHTSHHHAITPADVDDDADESEPAPLPDGEDDAPVIGL